MAQAARARELKRKASLARTTEAAANQSWSRFYKQAWFWCSLSLLFWLVVGTTFYMAWHEVARCIVSFIGIRMLERESR
jgi:hypothetical protein